MFSPRVLTTSPKKPSVWLEVSLCATNCRYENLRGSGEFAAKGMMHHRLFLLHCHLCFQAPVIFQSFSFAYNYDPDLAGPFVHAALFIVTMSDLFGILSVCMCLWNLCRHVSMHIWRTLMTCTQLPYLSFWSFHQIRRTGLCSHRQ